MSPPGTVSLPKPSVSTARVPEARVAALSPTTEQHPPVYCPRNVTAPGGLPRCLRREGGARGPAGEGSDPEAAVEDREAGRDPLASSRPAGSALG